ncbi:RecX family transcriptional regulator [Candidatus Saccharibacteria bacterium]|nr:RecX family transcriptional regulator [Candidatus Saccharibacteria bacterium]
MEIYSLTNDRKSLEDNKEEGAEDNLVGATFLITNIKPAIKNQNRVNIFINGRYEFSLDIAQVVDLKIKVGRRISEAELEKYRAASEFGLLYQRTLEWVLTRPHSVREAREYLIRKRIKRLSDNQIIARNKDRPREELRQYKMRTKEMPIFSDGDIDLVINRLSERGFLNDQKFAEFYVENRHAKKGISRRRLEQELVKKGIDSNIIEIVLAESERSEEDEIKKMISKKRSKYSDDKLIAYLVRQGFDYQRARAAVLGTD